MRKLKVLDLFSGIGGFSLGLERAGGFETVAFCEIEPYCRKVLAKHWPGVPCYDDVRTLTADTLARDGIAVDVICGGFPCQDLSFAGKRAGLSGERSGLWGEYRRLIGELRPRFVIAENVPGILSLGLGDVLRDLAALGYDACWECIPASAVGAPHRRDRWWLVAHPQQDGRHEPSQRRGFGESKNEGRVLELKGHRATSAHVADTNAGDEFRRRGALQMGWGRFAGETLNDGHARGIEWSPEPNVGRVAHVVPARVDRLGALGNAVVPQVVEKIGRAIVNVLQEMPN